MIISNRKNVNNFCINKFNFLVNYDDQLDYIQSLVPTFDDVADCKCPHCHRKDGKIRYGSYYRNLTIFHNCKTLTFRIKIQRILCKGCKHTHALLPNFVVPYVLMASFSIAKIIQDSATSSVYSFVKNVQDLSCQIVYYYLSLASLFFPQVLAVFNQLAFTNSNFKSISFNYNYFLTHNFEFCNEIFCDAFFYSQSWILYMKKFQNNSSPPVKLYVYNHPPT